MLTFGFDIVISFADKAISHEIIKKNEVWMSEIGKT